MLTDVKTWGRLKELGNERKELEGPVYKLTQRVVPMFMKL